MPTELKSYNIVVDVDHEELYNRVKQYLDNPAQPIEKPTEYLAEWWQSLPHVSQATVAAAYELRQPVVDAAKAIVAEFWGLGAEILPGKYGRGALAARLPAEAVREISKMSGVTLHDLSPRVG